MSTYTLTDERRGWYYHQGCLMNGVLCFLNIYYNGCKECIKYKEKKVNKID